jgi:NADH-quinone oxidoreductase subunit G
VIAHASTLSDSLREHADVVFPAEAYAEKEGTLVHPDGRLQRLRPAIGRPGSLGSGVRPAWQVIAEIAQQTGTDLGVLAGPMASAQLFDAVPFYAGLTLDTIGGRGIRWPSSGAAAALETTPWELAALTVPPLTGAAQDGTLRLGTWRSLWAAPEVDLSPALQFMQPHQVVELSPLDADRLGVRDGDEVEVGSNGTRVRGAARLRAAVPGGSVFLVEGTHDQPANVLTDPLVAVRRVGGGDA